MCCCFGPKYWHCTVLYSSTEYSCSNWAVAAVFQATAKYASCPAKGICGPCGPVAMRFVTANLEDNASLPERGLSWSLSLSLSVLSSLVGAGCWVRRQFLFHSWHNSMCWNFPSKNDAIAVMQPSAAFATLRSTSRCWHGRSRAASAVPPKRPLRTVVCWGCSMLLADPRSTCFRFYPSCWWVPVLRVVSSGVAEEKTPGTTANPKYHTDHMTWIIIFLAIGFSFSTWFCGRLFD